MLVVYMHADLPWVQLAIDPLATQTNATSVAMRWFTFVSFITASSEYVAINPSRFNSA